MYLIFAQVGAIHMHFPYINRQQFHPRPISFPLTFPLQVVSSADGIGLVLKDAIVEAAKAGQIAEECRDAKGVCAVVEREMMEDDGSLGISNS